MNSNREKALLVEIRRNRETADSLRKILDKEKDMLVASPEQRLTLTQFHTDVWDSFVSEGIISDLEPLEELTKSYQLVKELNAMINKFKRFGNIKTYTHYSRSEKKGYSRTKLLDLIEELCQEAYLALSHSDSLLPDGG